MESEARQIINKFEKVNKVESGFWLAYQKLSQVEKDTLSEFYPTISEMDLFEQICKFWNVS